ncbi:bacterial regulatory s, tetR family protein [Mycobacteroides abscessus]|nr:bacterial regulatory s, tetR family protein [Mycobacteroides abscessus]
METVDPDDLTARARIRDAALREFGDKGYDGATIRGIAARAGVSSGLLRHHFGSKQELRDACDEYLVKTMRDINEQVQANVERGDVHYVSARIPVGQYQAYITRALVEGSAGQLFDEMVAMTEGWLAVADQNRAYPGRCRCEVTRRRHHRDGLGGPAAPATCFAWLGGGHRFAGG